MRRHASAIGLAMAFGFIQGAALADPLIGDKPSPVAPAAAGPAAVVGPTGILPVATVPPDGPPPTRAALDPSEQRSERSRILSYIILQGLQGAGPFAGAR